jgi:C-terminal processing protease CtpA/Prc
MRHRVILFLLVIVVFAVTPSMAQDEIPPAEIVNDEGGPVVITGQVNYTNAFFTVGVAMPVIILEDQAGFIDRNRYFLMPVESQTLGQITTDFYTSPFIYTLAMPAVPQGSYRDVDNDGEDDAGVQVFAVAYWTNTWGDPFLEERDLYGGGWSSAYASTRVSEDVEDEYEIVGGKFVIYALDDQQGFPSGFGDDGLLFTEDDPIVLLPAGYTVVDLDADPFVFDRSHEVEIDLLEPEGAALDDFSEMSYTEAFDAMVELFRKEYAYTELKNLDWDELYDQFYPEFETAEENNDTVAYVSALRNFYLAIPDGHMGFPLYQPIVQQFLDETDGGLGLAIREIDDGRVIANFILSDGPADMASMELGTEILEIDGVPIEEAISEVVPWSGPFSTTHTERLQQLRYMTRFSLDTEVEITFKNPGENEATTATLMTVDERDSFAFSSFNVGLTGFELPLEYELLDSGYIYVKIYSFSDNDLLSIQLWERMLQNMNNDDVPGLIIDMRQNGGGSGFLADQMAAYFFDEALVIGNTGIYDEEYGDFYFDPRGEEVFYLPAESLRYHGDVAILVGPSCSSACEFFSYDMTIQDRAAIVGQYPTGGLGGGQKVFAMPEGIRLQFSIGRNVDADGNIYVEGTGVVPTVQVPVNEETLFSDGDPILEHAIDYLNGQSQTTIVEGGAITLGDTVTGEITTEGQRIRYSLDIPADVDLVDFLIEDSEVDAVLRIYIGDDFEAPVLAPIEEDVRGIGGAGGLSLVLEIGGAGDNATGSYTMTAQENTPVEFTTTAGGKVIIGDIVEGVLEESLRIRYTLEITADTSIDVLLSDETEEMDTYLRIYVDDAEEVTFENDDIEDGVVRNSRLLDLKVLGGQTLIIEVAGFGDLESGPFVLTIKKSAE